MCEYLVNRYKFLASKQASKQALCYNRYWWGSGAPTDGQSLLGGSVSSRQAGIFLSPFCPFVTLSEAKDLKA